MDTTTGTTKPPQPDMPPAAIPPPEFGGEFDLLAYVGILLAHWWLLAPLAVLGGAAGMAFCYYVPPLYRAVCRYEIFHNTMLNITETTDEQRGGRRYENPLDRQILLLKSRNLNGRILAQLKKEWNLDSSTNVLQKFSVEVRPVKGATDYMVDISVDSFDGEFSKEYIEALLEGFRELRLEETAQVLEETTSGLKEEEERLSKELDGLQTEIIDFETKNNLEFLQRKHESELEHLAQALAKQREISTQRTILESQFPFLADADVATLTDVLDLTVFTTGGTARKGGDTASSAGWSELPEWRDHEAAIVRLGAEYEHLRQTFKATHPKLIDLQNDIDKAKRELKTSAELALKRLQARRDALEMQEEALLSVAQKKRTGLELAQQEVARHAKLKARAQHLSALHEKVYARVIDLSTVNKDRYFARRVEGPYALKNPVWPQKTKMVGIGIFAATALGAGLVLLRFLRQARLYSLDAVEMTSGIPCLAGIPKASAQTVKKGGALFINVLPKSNALCEAYRSLRTSIDKTCNGSGQVLLITSPGAGDGKSFTVVNLASIFSWSNKKVLIIDGDLRRAGLRKAFGVDRKAKGLVECLQTDGADSLDWRDLLLRDIAPNIDFLPAGRSTESGAELLGTGTIDSILRGAREAYDVVVMDSSPVVHVVDAVLAARYVDAVILVARLGSTSGHALGYAVDRLNDLPLIGFVQNCLTAASRRYSHYGGYGHYGRYAKYGYRHYPPKQYEYPNS